MDGSAEVGGSPRFAREDHRHPATPPQGPLAGTDVTIGEDGRTVSVANQRPVAGAGTEVNDRTVSIRAGGVTDAMIGDRTINDPNVNQSAFTGDLTGIFNRFSAFLRALFTGNPLRLGVGAGGTGATDAAGARDNLGAEASGASRPGHVHAASDVTTGTLPAAMGGTGRTAEGRLALPLLTAAQMDNIGTLGENSTFMAFRFRGQHTAGLTGAWGYGIWARDDTADTHMQEIVSYFDGNTFRLRIFRRHSSSTTAWSPWIRMPEGVANTIAASGGDNVAASVSAVRNAIDAAGAGGGVARIGAYNRHSMTVGTFVLAVGAGSPPGNFVLGHLWKTWGSPSTDFIITRDPQPPPGFGIGGGALAGQWRVMGRIAYNRSNVCNGSLNIAVRIA